MLINHASRQVTAKIVYYGAGLSGKTTNLQYIFSVTNPTCRGELVSLETEIERTLFFDLLPINVGLIKGYQTKFQLYTVPGQVFYDSTRKLVLKGADGIVFVADSQELMEQANIDSYESLTENLAGHRANLAELPLVFQYNKRDLKNITPLNQLSRNLNKFNRPYFEAVAKNGKGVIETLREISSQTIVRINEMLELEASSAKKISVHFHIDRSQEIIKKEELPYKKISLDQAGESAGKVEDKAKTADKRSGEKTEPEPAVKRPPREQELSLLKKMEDATRLTKIEKVALNDSGMIIEIKGMDGAILKTFKIDLQPETQKVNLILDVKRQ